MRLSSAATRHLQLCRIAAAPISLWQSLSNWKKECTQPHKWPHVIPLSPSSQANRRTLSFLSCPIFSVLSVTLKSHCSCTLQFAHLLLFQRLVKLYQRFHSTIHPPIPIAFIFSLFFVSMSQPQAVKACTPQCQVTWIISPKWLASGQQFVGTIIGLIILTSTTSLDEGSWVYDGRSSPEIVHHVSIIFTRKWPWVMAYDHDWFNWVKKGVPVRGSYTMPEEFKWESCMKVNEEDGYGTRAWFGDAGV